jgi:hypothetical protein
VKRLFDLESDPQNRPCTPKIVGTFYMQEYKDKEKTAIVPHCTPSFKTQWAPCFIVICLTQQAIHFCRMPQDVRKLRCQIAQVPLYLQHHQNDIGGVIFCVLASCAVDR